MTTRYFTLLLGSYLAAMLGMTAMIDLVPSYASRYYALPMFVLLLVLGLLYLFNVLPSPFKTEKIGSYLRDSALGWVGLAVVNRAFFPAYSMQLYLIIALAFVLLIIIFVRTRYFFDYLLSSLAVVTGTTAATWVYYHLVFDLDVPAWRVFGGLLVVAMVIGATVVGSLYYRRNSAAYGS
jgi:hypothetical protein